MMHGPMMSFRATGKLSLAPASHFPPLLQLYAGHLIRPHANTHVLALF
jgi:hypothetical protein